MVRRARKTAWLWCGLVVCGAMLASPSEGQAQERKGTSKKERAKRIGNNHPVVGARAGYVVTGAGTRSTDVPSLPLLEQDYEDRSGLALNAFGLFPVGSGVKVGASVWYFPNYYLKNLDTGGTDLDDATALDLNAMAEYSTPMAVNFDGFVSAEAGWSLVFPPENVNTPEEEQSLSGLNLGLAVGGQYFLSSAFGLRGELRYQPYSSVTVTRSTGTGDITETQAGQRLMLVLGVSFGL
jgi:hypothetical protein